VALGQAPEIPMLEQTGASTDPIEAVLPLAYRDACRVLLEEFERRYLQCLLGKTGGNIRAASRKANMDRSYLMELLARHGMR
jgi:DNA-binding NtrC family response regulator